MYINIVLQARRSLGLDSQTDEMGWRREEKVNERIGGVDSFLYFHAS